MERGLFRLVLAASLGILAVLALPLFAGEVYVHSDLGRFWLPIRVFVARALAEGSSALWMPQLLTGFYLHGEGQMGLFHPGNRALYALLPFPVAFDLEMLRSYPAAWLGTYLFLRRWELPRSAAAFGALSFAFSGFLLLHHVHLNVLSISAHLPWQLFVVDLALRGRGRAAALAPPAAAFLTASQLLLGHHQFVWLSSLAEAAYALFLLGRGARLRGAAALVAAKALGFGIAAVQLVPTYATLQESVRGAPPEGLSFSLSLHPWNLLQLVGPFLFAGRVFGTSTTELSVYAGAVAPVLACWLLARRRACGPAWPLGAAALALAAVATLAAFGGYGFLYRLQAALPIVGLFRAPARYVLLVHAGLAVAGAVAFADLARRAARGERAGGPRAAVVVAPALAALAAAGLALVLKSAAPGSELARSLAPGAAIAAGPLLLGAASALVLAAGRGSRAAVFGVALFAAVDLGAYGLSMVPRAQARTVEAFVGSFRIPPEAARARLLGFHPAATIAGARLADGFVALFPLRRLDLGGYLPMPDPSPRQAAALRVANVGWSWGRTVEGTLPRARLVARARQSADPANDVAAIDPATTALVERPLDLGGGPPGEARIVRDRPGEIAIETDAPSRQLLAVSESHHAGWEALVDGEPAEVLRVYGDFLGCAVPPGRHEVRLRFAPSDLAAGKRISAVALALGLVWIAWAGARPRR